ncbi:cupin domain-containing protein [Pontibacter flavimaris]|uniref:hypothetical protein n=1 Tax=Pontibacter flavimaris TaxID=1797110 RepID=UPI00111527F0|nr:hypothetical protein [Pontibacter flavimaris]
MQIAKSRKQIEMKMYLLSAIPVLAFSLVGCKDQASDKATETQAIYPKGKAGFAGNFTGKAWNYGLVANDLTYNNHVGNVYFEPGAEVTERPIKSSLHERTRPPRP